jgi:hypothetical protein
VLLGTVIYQEAENILMGKKKETLKEVIIACLNDRDYDIVRSLGHRSHKPL